MLSDAEKGRLLVAMLEYGEKGILPQFDGMLALAWGFVKTKLDRDDETYENAKASGDTNIYFVDGAGILNIFGGDNGTVDTIHPNDLGFSCIAKALGDVLETIL